MLRVGELCFVCVCACDHEREFIVKKAHLLLIYILLLLACHARSYGSPEVTSGGNALKFYASVRLDTRRKEILPDNVGIRIKVKVVKNKVGAPFKTVNMDILFGSGIDSMGCTLDAALDLNILERKGSWYAWTGGENLAQGRVNAVEILKKEPELAARLESEVRLAFKEMGKPVKASTTEDEDDDVPVQDSVQDAMDSLSLVDGVDEVESFME
jgi:recombination protein RecA